MRYSSLMQGHREYIPLFEECEAFISFSPLSDESDPATLGLVLPSLLATVPSRKDANPFALAKEYGERFKGKRVCVLVPGRAFDVSGTRHGRGGGWYDRFLSAIPREWLRIGVCREKDFSEKPLERQAHDEPVDFIIIASSSGARVIPAENTRART